MSIAYIALGSNMGDRLGYLRRAKDALAQKLDIISVSLVYETEPIGTSQPDRFLNAVVAARTDFSPEEILALCLAIEEENGRVRSVRNAPRPLDLDLLLYDDLCIETPNLTVPHPRMHERAFVLTPLANIVPDVLHPTLNVPMRELLSQARAEELVFRTDYSL